MSVLYSVISSKGSFIKRRKKRRGKREVVERSHMVALSEPQEVTSHNTPLAKGALLRVFFLPNIDIRTMGE